MTQLFLQELTLTALLQLAREMPDSERRVYEVVSGSDFHVEDFAAGMFHARGMHHEFRRYADAVVAAGGFIPHRPGVYRTWFCAPEWAWKAHGAEITRLCASAVSAMLKGDLAHRIETVTLASETRARQWYEKIGLAYESTLRGYGSGGEDLVMYVAVKQQEKV